jgi:hypothetical protein
MPIWARVLAPIAYVTRREIGIPDLYPSPTRAGTDLRGW